MFEPCFTSLLLCPCHTGALAEVSINLKRRFFALNLKCVLNSLDFSLVSLTQNDKGLFVILSATEYSFYIVILNFA